MSARTRGRRVALAALGAVALLLGHAAPVLAQDDAIGRWTQLAPAPFFAPHVHLLPTGKILLWPGDGASGDNAHTWDPATEATTAVAKAGFDIFCSGHSFLADGRLLVAGGHVANEVGLPNVSAYDPFTNTWTAYPEMNAGRWYPTTITLPNGEVLILAGNIAWDPNTLPQVFQPATGTYRDLTTAELALTYYPQLFVAPNGKVFNSGWSPTTRYLDTSGTGAWTFVAERLGGFRDYGTGIMYAPGKIIVMGGGDPPLATAEVIDLNAATPAWRAVGSMSIGRRMHNATLLPDGTILVSGGSSGAGFSDSDNAVFTTQIWNPETETWAAAAPMSVPRLYHSTAILLPDGRVLMTGGNQVPNLEVYEPAYLFKGPRPTITTIPAAIGWGETFAVATPDAAAITKVNLIRLGSVTHSHNMSQSIVPLSFTVGASGLDVIAPADGIAAAPGYYMVFVLNGAGVPSVGAIVQVGASGSGPPPPPPPPPAGTPTLTSLTPSSAEAGSPGVPLTVDGGGFAADAVVQWNGSARPTTVVSATQLSAAIPASDVTTAGSAQVTVLNPGASGGTSTAATFSITAPPPPPPPPPGPTLTTLTPKTKTQGAAAFTLIVDGSGFVAGDVVQWNGAARTTTFVSATRVKAAIPASDVVSPGTVPVTVMHTNGGTSNALMFKINPKMFSLTVTKQQTNGLGGGKVTSQPTGINCGTVCKKNFAQDTVVVLTATPNATSAFVGWSGACTGSGTCTVTMTSPATVTAIFKQK